MFTFRPYPPRWHRQYIDSHTVYASEATNVMKGRLKEVYHYLFFFTSSLRIKETMAHQQT